MLYHKPALMLNSDYTPLRIVSWRRAICLSIIGKEIPGEGVRIIKYHDDYVTSAGGDFFPIPCVIVSNRYIKPKKPRLSKRNLLYRDDYECQYCGLELGTHNATVDHVVPRKLFKNKSHASSWENMVIACKPCNARKGGRTPEQANMQLNKKPKMVDHYTFWPHKVLPEWEEYLGHVKTKSLR